ncbi:MAG: DNA adenine methylase [Sulfobacillus sp.]
MQSPLRYPGGKTRACKILDRIVSDHFDMKRITTLISPFFGGGSFEFFLHGKYRLNVIANDKFSPLFNFWQTCQRDKESLCRRCAEVVASGVTRELFGSYREQIMKENDRLAQACMYFVINRCSFSGATLSGGFSTEAAAKRFTRSSIDKIGKLDLSAFQFYNLDFAPFLQDAQSSPNRDAHSSLIFLDPPYFLDNGKLYGNNGDLHENFDHRGLFNCLKNLDNWVMTYNDSPFVRELYRDFKIIETAWSYGMNKDKSSSEIVIVAPGSHAASPA